ncbi:MAG TPA: hypothetical protein VGJ15_04495 [Pirellulales bacterium]|jgi:hypothetical protein
MPEEELELLEPDSRFPSGTWTGFFLQYWIPGRHKTDAQLTFNNGQLSGAGSDWVGQYTIEGTYDAATGQCQWIKRYLGRHYVSYRGVNEGRGIWGVWELPQLMGLFVDRGGFHIWPEGADYGSESDEAEQALLAVMRKEFGNRALRVIRVVVVGGFVLATLYILGRLLWQAGR